jgi:hypothetical protein
MGSPSRAGRFRVAHMARHQLSALAAAIMTLAVCGVATTGCSDPSDTGTPAAHAAPAARDSISARARERRRIRRMVRRAKHEGTDGNATKTCRYFTADGQARAIQAYAMRYMRQLASCPAMVRFARKAEKYYLSDARRATIKKVTLQGTRAEVVFEGPKRGGYGGLVGVIVREENGRWLVDDTDFVPYGTGE